MITDAQTRFSNAQTLGSGTALSENVYDLGSARDVSRGDPLRVVVSVDTAFSGGTSLTANVVESANADLSSPTILVPGATIAVANLTLGTKIIDRVLPPTSKRYLGLQYVSVGTHTTGKVTGGIVLDSDSGTQFAANTGL